jgi:hypothetical protein
MALVNVTKRPTVFDVVVGKLALPIFGSHERLGKLAGPRSFVDQVNVRMITCFLNVTQRKFWFTALLMPVFNGDRCPVGGQCAAGRNVEATLCHGSKPSHPVIVIVPSIPGP